MPEPLSTLLFGAAFDWAVERIGDLGVGGLKARLQDRAAKTELGEITQRVVEAAANVAPELGDLLRSEAYLQNVLAPGILDILRDPGAGLDSTALAGRFIQRFVAPYAGRRDVDDVLSQTLGISPNR